ncbi:MAG: elongation factor P [Deinococcus sp.]|nr:elongation factor P [Deinococcus sp.]
MIEAGELRPGAKIELNEGLFEVVDCNFLKMAMAKGLMRTKLRNLETGATIERTFSSVEKLKDAYVEGRKMQYVYASGDERVFMDLETFDQMSLSEKIIGDGVKWLKDGIEVEVDMYQGRPVAVRLPNFVELRIVETDPGLRGDTVSGGSKPAKLETGAVVSVPLFVEQGTVIKVDTRSGKYLGRA